MTIALAGPTNTRTKTLTTVMAVIGGGVLVPVLVAHRHDLAAASALLVTVCPAWLSVAALAEAVSYLTRGRATRAGFTPRSGKKCVVASTRLPPISR